MTAHPIVLGTAGHIDHGKTSLVHALTGIDTDRLAVEKARGITTELGFARLDIGERRIAVVDVPGHERFVKSMVAGATGLDLVCLVIAADEGVMPQTREHLDICDLLGVRRGLIALSKVDLVEDPEWLAMVTADVRAAVAGTFLADAPIVPVSTRRPETLEALRAVIATIVDGLPVREASGVFRLAIDRVFTMKGFGTVVTGTILGGEVATSDELEVIPSGLATRVRGLEVHGVAVERALAGHRVAVNLAGVAVDQLARGDLLVHPGRVAASHILDVSVSLLKTAPAPLPTRSKVLVHHAATQVLATLVLVDAPELAPGGTCLAQLRVDAATPLGALPGDAFILRGFVATATHGSTIGGGRIIRVLAPKARRGAQHAETVAALAAARAEARIALDLASVAAAGLTVDDLVRRLGIPATPLAASLATLVASGELLPIQSAEGQTSRYLHARTVAELEARLVAAVPPEGIAREALRGTLPAVLPARAFDTIVAGLERRGTIVAATDRVARATAPRTPALGPSELALLARFAAWGVEPLRPKELPAALALSEAQAKASLDRLVAAKLVVRIKPDLFIHAQIVADVRTRLLAHLAVHGTIDPSQWKELTGASRKFTIPLAEYFDAEKLTLRVGDLRRKR